MSNFVEYVYRNYGFYSTDPLIQIQTNKKHSVFYWFIIRVYVMRCMPWHL